MEKLQNGHGETVYRLGRFALIEPTDRWLAEQRQRAEERLDKARALGCDAYLAELKRQNS